MIDPFVRHTIPMATCALCLSRRLDRLERRPTTTLTIPSEVQDGDAALFPDGLYDRVGGEWRKL